jgi:hypothetical protein
VVNAIMDACYRSARSKKWEAVLLDVWRGAEETEQETIQADDDAQYSLIKEERMPDGRTKLILRDKATGKIVQKIE